MIRLPSSSSISPFPSLFRSEQPPITALYKRMLRHLAQHGVVKTPATGPLEFVDLVRTRWAGALTFVATITELYCRGRFGGSRLRSEEHTSELQSRENRVCRL